MLRGDVGGEGWVSGTRNVDLKANFTLIKANICLLSPAFVFLPVLPSSSLSTLLFTLVRLG